MKREILFRGKSVNSGEWVYGYYVKLNKPSSDTEGFTHFILTGESDVFWGSGSAAETFQKHAVDPETVGQWTGLKDKNGKEIYEGDIIKWCQIETEWQTHTGDNIPNGSYTEPCGILSKWRTAQVYFNAPAFTTTHPDEELDFGCPLNPYNSIGYDREAIEQICFPDFPNSKIDDKELWEDGCLPIMEDLKIEADNLEAFLKSVNGYEVIGNIHEHPELLNQKEKA